MRPLVVDTNSIINFFKYYQFDKNHENKIFSKLVNFLKNKVFSGEVVIIDRVHEEVKAGAWNTEVRDFKRDIKSKAIETVYYTAEVDDLSRKYYKKENERFFQNAQGNVDQARIENAMNEYLDKVADLYLIAHCLKLKEQGVSPILITEESFKEDNKLVEKIPTICKKENEDIECHDIPFSLFEIYKDELKFKLNE